MIVPSITQILQASETEWRDLAAAAGITDTRWIEAQRARIGDKPARRTHRRRRPPASGGTTRRRNRAADAIFSAMLESLRRANGVQDGDDE
jgi:hypothetical protein